MGDMDLCDTFPRTCKRIIDKCVTKQDSTRINSNPPYRCFPHVNFLLQICKHWWSISIQQSVLHLWRPQLFNFVHRFLHVTSSVPLTKDLHFTSCSMCPQRHRTVVVFLHTGQSPTWHLLVQKCGFTDDPHLSTFLQTLLHTAISSMHDTRCPGRSSSFPQLHVVMNFGRSLHSPQAPTWHSSWHLWLPQASKRSQTFWHWKVLTSLFSGIQGTVLCDFSQ